MAGIQIDGVNNKIDFDDDQDTSISSATDDTLVVEVGGNTLATVTATTVSINDNTTITTDDNTDTLSLISTDADANVGPVLRLYRNSASAVDNDVIGNIIFSGNDTAGNETDYLTFQVNAGDADDGQEDGFMRILMPVASTSTEYVRFTPAEVVFNEGQQDIDFRIETASNNVFFNLQAVNSNNGAGTLGLNSSNADGNFLEIINPTSGVYTTNVEMSATSGNLYGLRITFDGQAPDNNTSAGIVMSDGSSLRFIVYADGDVVNHDNSYGALSDERIKSEIVDANSQWDDIKALKMRNYKKNEDIAKYGDKAWEQIGVIAQELEAAGMDKCVKQEVLYTSEDQETKDYLYTQKDKDQGLIPDGKDVGDVKIAKTANVGDIKTYKAVKYSVLYMKAIKALQEAMAKIETLETKVAALEGN